MKLVRVYEIADLRRLIKYVFGSAPKRIDFSGIEFERIDFG
jgi:DNA primase catalytic subunit